MIRFIPFAPITSKLVVDLALSLASALVGRTGPVLRSCLYRRTEPVLPTLSNASGIFTKSSALGLTILLCVPSAFAHPTPKGLTTIERNPNTNTIEITHRFHLHDAEEAMQIILSDGDLRLESIEGRAKLALHVEAAFQLVDGESNTPVPLTLVGAQIADDNVLVFQEYTDELPQSIKITHDALRDAFPQQVNTLNVKLSSRIQTLVFRDANKWKTLKR